MTSTPTFGSVPFLARLRRVAAKAAAMIEERLYRDLTRLMFLFWDADGLLDKIVAASRVYQHLLQMVRLGDEQVRALLEVVDEALDAMCDKLVRDDPAAAFAIETTWRSRGAA